MQILACVELLLQNRLSCGGAAELWAVPASVLALLHLRLGCRLAKGLCCSVVCGIGASCSPLAALPAELLLGDSKTVADGVGRLVLLSCERSLDLPVVELPLQMGDVQRSCVTDSPALQRFLRCRLRLCGIHAAHVFPETRGALALPTDPCAGQTEICGRGESS